MNIEDRIRSRIEAILMNDAKNYAEMRGMEEGSELLADDNFEEERNLYQRIISNYRNAVSEVNRLLEESVGLVSGFYRILENIREKNNFHEMCSQIVECVLQDFGAEYCSLLFLKPFDNELDPFCVEGILEDRKFLRIHSQSTLLGSAAFEQVIENIIAESPECATIPDVYRDSRFNAIDFPSVIRSLVCLPIHLQQRPIGALILSNSQPTFFKENHFRILKVLASIVAHLRLLTIGIPQHTTSLKREANLQAKEDPDVISVVLLNFERVDVFKRTKPLDKENIRGIRKWLAGYLGPRESVVFKGDQELIMFLPGTTAEDLSPRVLALSEAFQRWKVERGSGFHNLQMSIGYSTCEEGDDLTRTLEIASVNMHPELPQDLDIAAQS